MRLLLMLAGLSVVVRSAEPWIGSNPHMDISTQDLDLPLTDGGIAVIRVYQPTAGDGPWPVVIFSHGLGGSRTGYSFLAKRWSEHGYVVIMPNHPGSDLDTFRGKKPIELAQALKHAASDPEIWAGRPKLITQIIDALPALEHAIPALAGHIDHEHIGVGGHSYGGSTTMLLAGQRVRGPGGGLLDLSDKRPIAFAALSPPGPSSISDPSDWSHCTRPLLVMTGTADSQPALLNTASEVRSGAWRRKVYDNAPSDGTKLLAWFDGATHTTYADGAGAVLTGEPKPDPAHVEAVAVITLAWWDARLRGDARAKAWLEDPTTPAALGSWAHFERH